MDAPARLIAATLTRADSRVIRPTIWLGGSVLEIARLASPGVALAVSFRPTSLCVLGCMSWALECSMRDACRSAKRVMVAGRVERRVRVSDELLCQRDDLAAPARLSPKGTRPAGEVHAPLRGRRRGRAARRRSTAAPGARCAPRLPDSETEQRRVFAAAICAARIPSSGYQAGSTPAARSLSSVPRRRRTRAYSRISWCPPRGRVPRAAHRCAPAKDTARVSRGPHKDHVKTADGVKTMSRGPAVRRRSGSRCPDPS